MTNCADSIVLDSLRRRMRAVFSLYEDATASMDLEHVNHQARPDVLPIAFSLFHIVNMIDASLMLLNGAPPLYDQKWADEIAPAINDHGKHRTVEEMVDQRIGDYAAFTRYMNEVFHRVESWLATLEEADLHRVIFSHPYPPQIASTFSARVGGSAGITVLDGLECWIYQHALRHMGEIEYARHLVGLRGMTS
jgi:hypothetical protein